MKEKNMPDLRPVDKFVKRKLLIENNGIFQQFYRQVPKATFFLPLSVKNFAAC